MSSNVLVVGDALDGVIHPTVTQLVSAASQICEDASKVTLCLVVDGSFDEDCIEGLGVGKVVLLEHPDASADSASGVYSLITELVSAEVSRSSPSVVLVAKTDTWFGRFSPSSSAIWRWIGIRLYRYGTQRRGQSSSNPSSSWRKRSRRLRIFWRWTTSRLSSTRSVRRSREFRR